jgi:pimeloyl-ACP methyl ester carboxylesterase
MTGPRPVIEIAAGKEEMLLSIVNSGGTKIYYDDRGDGEPALLCIPGFTNDHSIFAPLAKRLSQDHRVLIMDLRGHGKSQASEKAFGFAEIAEDAIAVIQGSGAQKVALTVLEPSSVPATSWLPSPPPSLGRGGHTPRKRLRSP